MLDYLLVNGSCPDFEKGEFVKANIGIKEGKISYIGASEPEAARVIDASGKIVSAGFIDIHMHEDKLKAEGKYTIARMMLSQGVTTAVGGNCGIQEHDLKDFKELIKAKGGAPINYIMLAGYNQFRYEQNLGHYDKVTRAQQEFIKDRLRRELSEGAWGISFGIEYDPAMDYEDMLDALSVSEDPNLLAAAHYRYDCVPDIYPIEEMIKLSSEIPMKFQISHLSSCGALGRMQECLNAINAAMDEEEKKGTHKLDYDTYPYNAFSTHIGSTVFEDGCFDMWKKTYNDILLTQAPYENVRCTKEIFEDARKNYPEMLAVAFVMNEDEIGLAIKNRHGMVASDGIITAGNGHPRAAGTFPRVLGKYARDEKLLPLIDALRKITLEPAKRLGIEGSKGFIKEGADADITVFDPETVADLATFENSALPPEGIDFVFVGGKLALEGGKILSEKNGAFLPYPHKA